MTQDKLFEFLEFFNNDLVVGSKWFLLDLQWMVDRGGETRKLECNFNGVKPSYTTTGKRRRISSSLLIRNPYRDSQEFFDQYIVLVEIDNLADIIERLAEFSNENLPDNLPV